MKIKMNYPLKSSNYEDRRRNLRNKALLTIVIVVLGILIIASGPIKRVMFYMAEPLWKFENSILNSSFFEYFKSKQVLIGERVAIEQKLFMAGNLLSINETLQNENEALKSLLNREDTKLKSILASVLVKPPQTPYDMLIVDIGEDYGIKVGDKVVANSNVFIGEVSEVFPSTVKIILYSTPGRKLSVVLGASSISVEAVGIGGGNFNIFLPREVEVKEGDVIVIPSITSNVFGVVEKVNFKDKDSFQTVFFKSPVNISELSFVEIINNK